MLKTFFAFTLLFTLIACKDKPNANSPIINPKQTKTFTLKVVNHSIPVDIVQLQGFFGDQKIEIDNRQINDTVYFFEFSELDACGVYRLQLDNLVFDFIYNKENIEIALNPKQGLDAIEIIQSKENKKFYAFLKAYANTLSTDEDNICEEAQKIEEELLNEKILFADTINAFLYNSTFNCKKLNHPKFIDKLDLNSKLLHTPYFTSQLGTVINSAIYTNKNLDSTLYLLCENKSDDLVHFIRNAFWRSGIEAKNMNCIKPLFSNFETNLSFEKDTLTLFKIGDKLEDDLFKTTDSNIKQHIILIEGNGIKISNKTIASLKEKIKNDMNSELIKLDINNLPKETQIKYNLIKAPLILVFGRNNELRQRYLGRIGLKHAVN